MNARGNQNRNNNRYEPYDRHRDVNEQNTERHYVGYDYMELAADSAELSFLLDSYEAFGWELDEYAAQQREHNRHVPSVGSKAVLVLKRDRKIINKAELTRLQRNFEACVRELELLERSKTSKASALALIIGVIGTAFMTGSVFAVVADPPHVVLCILLAIPAFIGWAVPYPLYRRITVQETVRIDALMEQKYDEIYVICERGSRLSYGSKEA